MRVWVWHNGGDLETLAIVQEFLQHPRLHRFHHSHDNVKLTEPTNWLWREADGEYVSKVDDDSLVPVGWGQKLREAHESNPQFGAIGCWPFPDEDFNAAASARKIQTFNDGHKILRHPWLNGSGYVMKRRCLDAGCRLRDGQSFPDYVGALAWLGWINGWYFPFIYQDHMDDPRSVHTLIKTDDDIRKFMPLTAAKNGAATVKDWTDLLRKMSQHIQRSSPLPGRLYSARVLANRLRQRLRAIEHIDNGR
jgi:hypothetical protein